jgi:hypothetical protein
MRGNYLIAVLLVFVLNAVALSAPSIDEIDRIRIAEAFRIGEKVQNDLWKDWDKAPFSMLFITDEHEFLIRHPKPSDEFQTLGYDKLLKSEVFWRPRKFQKSFLATFPAFGRTPVIVIGKAENTASKTSTEWVFVVLHEHFHQLQYSKPTYFDDVNALGLARGDTSGMWQINYPFPYKTAEIAGKFRELTDQLLAAYSARRSKDARTKLNEYLTARKEFAAMLTPDDYRYASFQLWQEGIARYTQYRMTEIGAKKVKPSKQFRALKDYVSFKSESDRLLAATLNEMKTLDLAKWERTVFYPFGAVEGLVLDELNPKWRDHYFTDKFALEKFYP